MDEEAQEDSECPVCYESLTDRARTLSCGHHFCHDCLVRTLLNTHTNLNGSIKRDNIICPVCRHLTFIKKLHGLTFAPAEAKTKTLEVPPVPTPVLNAGHGSHGGGLGCFGGCLRRISCRLCRRRLVCPKDASEVFIISELGRPMTEGDVIDIGTTSAMQRDYSNGRRLCTISCCLLILMITFTLLALVAATLPWVLLA